MLDSNSSTLEVTDANSRKIDLLTADSVTAPADLPITSLDVFDRHKNCKLQDESVPNNSKQTFDCNSSVGSHLVATLEYDRKMHWGKFYGFFANGILTNGILTQPFSIYFDNCK